MHSRRVAVLSLLGSLVASMFVAVGPAAAETMTASGMLSALDVAPENNAGYDRSYFNHWIDADHNGCDTRQEVLLAESTVATSPADGGCPVTSGNWVSWYDGATWTNPSDVDIDHMVPLGEAWGSGAASWTPQQRQDYANELTIDATLVAVTDNVNQSKGERDPAEWMPPANSAVCRYLADWIAVKYRWNLTVDQAEHDTISSDLGNQCVGLTVQVPPKANTLSPTGQIEAYITQVYSDLFNRTPDAEGLATWSAALRTGVAYGAVADGITYSDEYRSRMITEAYQTYLDRAPDAGGLQSWLTAMRVSLHIENMQAGFTSSPEYYSLSGGTDRGWITRLYEKVLNREPASSEVDYWQQQLNNGRSRYEVALGFLYSTEHLTTVVDGYYVNLLRRHIDPSGQVTWVGLIQTGSRDEQIIAGLVSSAEYRAKFGLA